MVRQRKQKPAVSPSESDTESRFEEIEDIPLARPEPEEIPEDEQWRLVNQTGVLNRIPRPPSPNTLLEQEAPLANELLDASMFIIPLSSLLLVMDILVHNQYADYPPLKEFVERMVTGVPLLSVFVFYTKRHQNDLKVKGLMFLLSLLAGPRLLWLLARGSWTANIRQCPPLITIWVYTIVQLDLLPAIASLALCGVFVWWKGLKRYLM